MDLEGLKSNLHALKQLYGLLRNDGNGLPNSQSDMLDDNSRLLLKDLLDRAAENVFKIYTEVLGAAQVGVSLTECSEKAQQLAVTEASDTPETAANDQNSSMGFTESENERRFGEPKTQRSSVMQPMLRHKYCRVCQRRIVRQSVGSSSLAAASGDARNGVKSNNNEDNELRGTTTNLLDCISRENIESSTNFASNSPAEAVESALEQKCLSYFSAEASDAIKKIEELILDLHRGTENLENNGTSSLVPISGADQQELSDKMNNIVLQSESTCSFVMEKLTRNEPNKSESSATAGTIEGSSSLHHLPSMTRNCPGEMELLNFTAKETMRSPVSSQKIGNCSGLVPTTTQIDIKNPPGEIKRQNHMMDLVLDQKVKSNVGKLEPDYARNYYWGDDYKRSKRVAASSSICLANKTDREDLRRMVREEEIMKPGARPTRMQHRISREYARNQNTWGLDYSRHKANQFLESQSRKAFPEEIRRHQHPARRILQHQDESDGTSLSSDSLTWKSQQSSSMSYSGSEEYFPPHQIRRWNYASSPTSRENWGLSSSEDDIYSWQSSDIPYESTSWSSDERKGSSLPSNASSSQASYTSDGDTEEHYPYKHQQFQQHRRQRREFSVSSTSSRMFRPSRVVNASSRRKSSGKKIGRWKKLKDKLSIIFHHHHHHHHHHLYHDEEEDLSNRENRKIHGRILSKHTAENIHPLRPEEAYEKQALEKIGKTVIHGRDRNKQHKPGKDLIGGLFKHIRHSKGSKSSAKHLKPLKQRQHHDGGNKVSAKLNWLKILQPHKKVKKLGIGYRNR